MIGVIIGAIIGGVFFSWLFDLNDPKAIMRHEKGDTSGGKGKTGVILLLLAALALLLIEAAPVVMIGGIPSK